MEAGFDRLTAAVSAALARPLAFALAMISLVVWALFGPVFDYSTTWQNVGNLWMSLVTFAMTFIILASGSREGAAVQVKLNEILRAIPQARNDLIAVEERTAAEIAEAARALREQAISDEAMTR